MDQPGEVANPARGQLNRENEYFSVPVRASYFTGLSNVVLVRLRQRRFFKEYESRSLCSFEPLKNGFDPPITYDTKCSVERLC